jgi:outer membrane protein OmpA-like peptidoglycan-associated protein
MHGGRKFTIALAVLLCWIAIGAAYGDGEIKIKGLIVGRTGESLTVKTADGGKVVVVLNDDTKVQQPKGLGIRKKQMSAAVLIPGLRVSVTGTGDPQTQVVAKTINFSGDDLQMAEQIQAGLTPTKHAVQTNQQSIETNKENIQANRQVTTANQVQIAANRQQIDTNADDIQKTNQRFSELTEYDTKGEATVYFAVGSTAIAAKDKAALMELAHTAVNLTGYIIQVKGFADSSGNAAMNQRLSMERAQAVVAFLLQDANVPVRHIVAPGAMGTADPAAPNETANGRADNRRVEVKVLVNRGLAGS